MADFRQFYGVRIRDALDGTLPAHDVLELLPGLFQETGSRFRANWLKTHPAAPGGDDGMSFLGWSQDSMLLAQIHNALIAKYAGKKAKDLMILGPKSKREPQLFAPTIADFNVGRFMAVINST